jgi:uncharacterized membrane protein YeaQ/YmgE (transglycosylase-associated protein family)
VSLELFLLVVVIVTALGFDFTNGFHDTGDAVAMSTVLNLVGAFLSTAIAATLAKDPVDGHLVTLELVFAGLVGGIVWNLLTWLLGIPSSSSHTLIGGIVGAMIAAVGHLRAGAGGSRRGCAVHCPRRHRAPHGLVHPRRTTAEVASNCPLFTTEARRGSDAV